MRALVLVDIQNDFLPGGALPVPEGDEIIEVVNDLQLRFDLVVATQDWHPHDHGSFAANHPGKKPGDVIELNGLRQILWPAHCVQGTRGAAFVGLLHMGRIDRVFQKGTDPAIDSYSGFFDNGHRRSTGLAEYLKAEAVTDLYVAGLATDYCVRFTALDARKLGFNTFVIEDATRGVNLRPTDSREALEELRRAGVEVVQSHQVAPEHAYA
jgi:nicotinamidase/pyrazinamidase